MYKTLLNLTLTLGFLAVNAQSAMAGTTAHSAPPPPAGKVATPSSGPAVAEKPLAFSLSVYEVNPAIMDEGNNPANGGAGGEIGGGDS